MTSRRITILCAMCLAAAAFGQAGRVLEINGGTLNPKGTRAAGTIFGASYGLSVDERVDLSLGLAFFHKGFTQKTQVATGSTPSGGTINTVEKELEYSTTLLPLTATATVHVPLAPPLGWYAGVSLAYEWLFDKYTNYEEKSTQKVRFGGFGWMAFAGLEFTIGSRSSLTAGAFYNKCLVKGNRKSVEGMPVWDEVDVSGLGFRGGLRLVLD